jgi:hypothetical protein
MSWFITIIPHHDEPQLVKIVFASLDHLKNVQAVLEGRRLRLYKGMINKGKYSECNWGRNYQPRKRDSLENR